jgi:hypothetical protein
MKQGEEISPFSKGSGITQNNYKIKAIFINFAIFIPRRKNILWFIEKSLATLFHT